MTAVQTERGRDTAAPVLVGAVVVAAIVARCYTSSPLWLDETLSVNIARGSLGNLFDALRDEVHPPLYYVLLNGWMRVFGEGDLAVRLLSGVFSVASLPFAYLAGTRAAGTRAGLWALVLIGLSPFCIRYATETRMYSLMMLLALVGHVVLRRALDAPTTGRLTAIAVVSALLFYTHYWSVYLLAVVGAFLLVAWRRGHPNALRIAVAMAASGIAVLPWLPRLLDQLAESGTPWGEPFRPTAAAAVTLVDLGGFGFAEVPLLGIVVVVLVALACFRRSSDRSVLELDLARPQPIAVEVLVAATTLLVGTAIAFATDGTYATRYASAFVPALLVAAAVGAATLRGAAAWIVAACVVALSAAGIVANVRDSRTQAVEIADAIAAREPTATDLVVYCPDQLGPAVDRVLDQDGVDVSQVTFPDLRSPALVRWIDYVDRIEATTPQAFAGTIDETAGAGRIFFVWSGGYRTHVRTCERIVIALGGLRGPGAEAVNEDGLAFYEHANLVIFKGGS